ncbi:TPA: hypothetical protein ACXOJ1_001137 [Pseudomonas aeruginosa]|uniref:hypothetical protein n=1 Tax=Pseudomonas aeruginosa TaxID=287 RepID=UPI00159CE34E|nr:hypothetical protein [Pseudomonas aeruginosa]MBH3668835.1 hypothetical protein [Pseudomonas aeruginosa]QKZ74085.1 hypothetical protein HWN49_01360 [Pseudomonas aeruginosa]HBP1918989.1 hypothetical protein [Pseudomonas aeruginosa]HBP1974959.1 hypothetical protein [Pseudomonas aeruginosa]HBP1987711.1 hypothetical protein [Pseudomonas aeruginosa]
MDMRSVYVEQATLILKVLFLDQSVADEASTKFISSNLDVEQGEIDKAISFR